MPCGLGQFHFNIGAFVEDETRALLQRPGEEIQDAMKRRDGPSGDNIRHFDECGCLGTGSHYAHVAKFERFDGTIHKAGFFLGGFGKGESDIRQHERKRNAGKAGAGTGIEDTPGVGKMTPGHNGVTNVFDGGFLGTGEPREVHMLIGGNDELKMFGGFGDQPLAMRNLCGKNAIELLSKHLFFIMALRVTRR